MAVSLHYAVIPTWLQLLGSAHKLLDKAEAHCDSDTAKERELLETRLADDMLPLAYQFKSCWTHSKLALEAARSGSFSPDMSPYPTTFAALRAKLDEAVSACKAIGEQELEDVAENDLVFSIGEKFRLDFAVQDFLLSFSTPNLHFHCATAYDIMRKKGFDLGKRDFLGRMRLKA
ncbi:DUF1993 domain-containing protein [Qipengyuania atrilutea]|uniref:DUF1993 domain-containing protein n=1 Tax=Qipengyuania atrilutea TaxID=2744473 RepID=A0A850H0K6_9SPHN|nr:DUF1993 domain-containing protein [Actirhodobacter atriluteus]NVD43468.1 DUF1993 domain-containing protein [Actirhodobacter atriluteus]